VHASRNRSVGWRELNRLINAHATFAMASPRIGDDRAKELLDRCASWGFFQHTEHALRPSLPIVVKCSQEQVSLAVECGIQAAFAQSGGLKEICE